MSTTPEALASTPDAPVIPAQELPDGPAPETGNEADPSPAAKVDASDSTEPEAKWVQKRIDELTKLRHEAERREKDAAKERDHWRTLAMRETPAPTQQQPKPQEPPKPQTLADFGFDEAKYHGYLLGEAARAATEAARKELQQEQDRAERQRMTEGYLESARKFAKDHPDFASVANNPDLPISEAVRDVILGIETGPEVAYYLGKNPEMAAELSRLPGTYAAYEIGQIAARLSYEREAAQKAKAVVSGAPPPAPGINGTAPGIVVKASDPESDKLPHDQWLELRNKEVRRKRKGA